MRSRGKRSKYIFGQYDQGRSAHLDNSYHMVRLSNSTKLDSLKLQKQMFWLKETLKKSNSGPFTGHWLYLRANMKMYMDK
jgi:hypothetical protein